MAFSVSYTIQGVDKFSKTAERIERSVNKIDRKVESFSMNATKRFRNVAAGLAGMFSAAAVVAGGTAITRIGGRFQDQLADLSAITGATGKDLDLLKSKSFSLGKEMADSGANVLEAFKLVGSAKAELLGNIPALISTTEQVLLLKNAAGIDLASAAQYTAQALNIFGVGADQASRFVNVLAAGAKEGASEVANTGEAMLIAGPLAANLGLSFEKVNAMLQGIAQGGIVGSRAGTGLQAVLSRLSKEGVDFKKIGMSELFLKVGAAIDKQTDSAKKAALIDRLFGQEHAKTGLTLVSQAKTLDVLERKLTGTNIAQEQASIRLATFNSKMRKIGTGIEEKIVATFLRLMPTIEKIATRFENWIASISSEDVDRFAQSIAMLADGLSRLIGILSGPGGSVLKGGITVAAQTLGLTDATAKYRQEVSAFQAQKPEASKLEIVVSGNTEFVSKLKSPTGSIANLKTGPIMGTL